MNSGTVLYVEDEENDIIFLRRAWRKAELPNPLQVVGDGEEAIQYLSGKGHYGDREKHPFPFLVLLDLKLPKVPGFNVLKWIRENASTHTMQVLVFSSSNQPADTYRAHSLGANAYIVKPPNSDELVELAASLRDFWVKQAQAPPRVIGFESEPSIGEQGLPDPGCPPGEEVPPH